MPVQLRTPASMATRIRRTVIEQSWRAGTGHIGSALSIADILAALYGDVLRIAHPDDPERDRFILSKGHAGLALYAALQERGWLDDGDLATYCANGSLLGVHPDHALRGIDFSTGSLGQGLSMGAGAALAARLQRSDRRVFVLLSDAECNEGAVWEAAMFAAHHGLANLVAVVDLNGQQALGYTRDVLDLSPLGDRWRAFGWQVQEVNGHEHLELVRALTPDPIAAGPRVVIARTTFGKGVAYMENRLEWHYLPMTESHYQEALAQINAAACAKLSSER